MPVFDPPPKSLLMRHRQLAPNASVRVSPLCLGTMTFGDQQQERYGEITKQTAFDILDKFYASGGNFLDTANAYQNGQSEEWIGEWMAARKNRDQMVVATKYTTAYRKAHKDEIQSNYIGNGSKSMKLSLEASLKKLQTTYVDVLYVHWWDYTTTIEELMHSLNDLVVSGKVLYLGISDCPAWVVSSANRYARDHGLRPFVVYQGMWNAAMRDFERDIIPMCKSEGMGLAPYGVLNQGRFQTKKGFEEREKHNQGRNFIPTSARDKEVSAILEALADRKGCQLVQVALAYCLQKTPYVFPIVGGRKVEHIEGNIDGLSVELTAEEVEEVERAYPFDHGFPHTFLSGTLFKGTDELDQRQVSGPGDVALTKLGGTFDWVSQPQAIRPSDGIKDKN
ncbi:Norsolorinic acid reductase B [Colletotrichum truncatum]|uniref:Norsolorinic acid reductase B n=1 Tax=Colletotrichum truncatum TaxID=5467 RepID=A0ACC3YXY7_COLTU|nr:Norsolorinic acid reductase B [Colletotrichum truncatum]KAF6790873.1 Norsolorinic acid reductase B [Colletotrichum truncatum]